jgi:hypothetical protein
VMIGTVLVVTKPSLAIEWITTETAIGDWIVGSKTTDNKPPSTCTLKNAPWSVSLVDRFDVIEFHFYPAVPAVPGYPELKGVEARVSVSLESHTTKPQGDADTSFELDAGGKRRTIRGWNAQDKRAYFALTWDEATQVLKAISEIGANRRLSIIGLGTWFHPSLFEFDKALVLLNACIGKMRF